MTGAFSLMKKGRGEKRPVLGDASSDTWIDPLLSAVSRHDDDDDDDDDAAR